MKRLAIALSGGVDSLVAAALLKRENSNVIGIHFRTGFEKKSSDLKNLPDTSLESRLKAAADALNIPLVFVDISERFRADVVRNFLSEYQNGRTPNPCMVCNRCIKFGELLDRARELGAKYLATGHYARLVQGTLGRFQLLRGIDPNKDQSYFLALLTQDQLKSACFPLGGYTKEDVRKMAERFNIAPLVEEESQEICFIEGNDYPRFLKKEGIHGDPGPIVDQTGKALGTHQGLFAYTIGQRRGIGIPAAEPYYVIRIDIEKNQLVVGNKSDLYSAECEVEGINWIALPPDGPIKVETRIRYRHKEAPSTLIPTENNKAIVRFDSPQEAVTPGQGAVFYQGDKVIGGGWIRKAIIHRKDTKE
ncbi:MAG: tRNA 2-thiouridine(34) synthase MnmA [Deltaproteobacteria bacterium]|nr:tRNA 2-thiouridine(34) synthase MnmA [Deltaproteobacteria bacterium]